MKELYLDDSHRNQVEGEKRERGRKREDRKKVEKREERD